ncbi:hypothetical protein HCU40_16595 [Pseudanabaena biceps]|nr:hypothetical protein [Pseudanabaena biceps]
MTQFTKIYDQSHNFVDGNITVENTLSNLGKAYLEMLVTGLSDSLGYPILLGFLYQIDIDSKRSKPYPIVSQRQTINLDLSECEIFLFIPSNRLIDDYILKLYLSTESGSSSSIDLSAYALRADIPSLNNYVDDSELASALSNYALASQLPDLSNYVTNFSLANALVDYVLAADLPSNSIGISQNFVSISENVTLESNKKYLAGISNLICSLPVNPAIGDVINLATGNYTFRINHGNASQKILNLTTQTTGDTDSGIILKPYSSIELNYLGFDLWVSGFRNRTINNYTPIIGESTPTLKAYTATLFNNATFTDGTNLSNINNDRLATGGESSDSMNSNSTVVQVLVSFTDAIFLDYFEFYNGQGNYPTGYANPDYKTSTINVYSGNNLSNLIGGFNPVSTNGIKQTFNVNNNSQKYSNYIFEFIRVGGTSVGVLELDLFGRQSVGGETIAV